MHSVPLLIRQTLRSSAGVARRTPQIRTPRPALTTDFNRRPYARNFSVCLQCQFHHHSRVFAQKNEENASGSQTIESEKASPSPAEAAQKEQPEVHVPPTKSSGDNLPSEAEGRRSQLSKNFTTLMDNLQSNIFIVGQRLNDLTGYSAIEKLKQDIQKQEERVREARALVRQAKEAYSQAINRRSASQREVNELLQRKHAWSPADLERFTSLYRSDHANEVAENEAQVALANAEREVEEATAQLNRSILSRYHEEQIWSDKIRRMSTWGTWGLMGVNIFLFLVIQILVEPWRRSRLVKGFEDKVKEAIESEAALVRALATGPNQVVDHSEDDMIVTSADADSSPEPPIYTPEEVASTGTSPADQTPPSEDSTKHLSDTTPTDPLSVEYWKHKLYTLISDESIAITQRQLTTIAVQSAAAGAVATGLLVALLKPR